MRNLLLLVPPNISFQEFVLPSKNTKVFYKNGVEFGSLITDMPLGVISLSAFIKKEIDCNVELIDFNVELNKLDEFDYESFYNYFKDVLNQKYSSDQFDVIGLSSLFVTSYNSLLSLGKACREVFSSSLIIAGGNVPTVSYDKIFKDTDVFDAICYGEGEIPLSNMIKSTDMLKYFEEDESWITKDKILSQVQFRHNFIWDLDAIPFDYSIIDASDYSINPTIKYYAGERAGKKSFNIMTSRGCPFRCVFCASHATHGRKMRYESLDRVKANILHLKNIGVEVVTFEDDHFMGDKKRAYEVVKYVGSIGLTAFFPNSLALYALDREMLVALKNAGVSQLILAVESGSVHVLRNVMKKPLKLDIVKRVAQDCRDIGIYTDCNILFGLPGETKKDIEDTRFFLKTLKANWFRINVATPLLGSEMYDICVENGYLKESLVDSNYKKAIVETEDFTANYIQNIAYDVNIELNFIYNADMELGHYEVAIEGFVNTLKAKPDHALAHYYMAICCDKLHNHAGFKEHMSQYKKISKDTFWKKYTDRYNLP